MNLQRDHSRKNHAKSFSIGLIAVALVTLLPFILLGRHVYIRIHDDLDGELGYFHVLKISGLLFGFDASTPVPNVMNGLPRGFFNSEFSFIRLLFYFFPTFIAYIINSLLVHTTGFCGMYLLAKDHLLKKSQAKMILPIAVLYGLLPVYPLYGISVMGLPLLAWAFVNLNYNRNKLGSWAFIAFFPFYVHIAMIGPFVLAAITGYGILKWIFDRERIHRRFFGGLLLLLCCFLLANCMTIWNFIAPSQYISNRVETTVAPFSAYWSFKHFIYTILFGHYHAGSFLAIPVYLFGLMAAYHVKNDRRKLWLILTPYIVIAVIALLEGFYTIIAYQFRSSLHFLTVFHINRFILLIPLLWFIIFTFAIRFTFDKINHALLYSIITLQGLFIISQCEELKVNYARIFHAGDDRISFASYFSEDLFREVDQFISRPKISYRIVSIGMHPAVSQYNGFYTLDSYQNTYPLSYKHEFRKIIAKELDKNETIRNLYDNWGSRCYIFSDELQKSCYWTCFKNCNAQINHLDIDTKALKEMGCEYIFSAVPVLNAGEINIVLLKKFSSDNALWDIYLYKL